MNAPINQNNYQTQLLSRSAACAPCPSILSDIYLEEVNIAVWENELSLIASAEAQSLISESPNLKMAIAVTPQDVMQQLTEKDVHFENKHALKTHIQTLVDMFCTLFELKRVGLRLTVLENAMCPKFHVDKIPCRLVSTFFGPATEWLAHADVDQTKLGKGSAGLTDSESGIYQDDSHIKQLNTGDVALLKGTGWFNNEFSGLVHRSPKQAEHQKRLVITLDFID